MSQAAGISIGMAANKRVIVTVHADYGSQAVELSPSTARAVAQMLDDAADECDRMEESNG